MHLIFLGIQKPYPFIKLSDVYGKGKDAGRRLLGPKLRIPSRHFVNMTEENAEKNPPLASSPRTPK